MCVYEKILKNNGYEMDRVFVSNEVGLTKATGNLYQYVKSELNVKPKEILHIGDNFWSDYKNAEDKGFRAVFINSPMSLYRGDNISIYSGDITACNSF